VEVPRSDATVAAARILAELPIIDLSIQDPPIEEVIAVAFEHRGSSESP
jgi:hypothetical protein